MMTTAEKIAAIRSELETRKDRSAYARGVTAYALDILDELEEAAKFNGDLPWGDYDAMKARALNGASSWTQYSEAGCALVYNSDIVERLCPPYMIRRWYETSRLDNVDWLRKQGAALASAWVRLWSVIRRYCDK